MCEKTGDALLVLWSRRYRSHDMTPTVFLARSRELEEMEAETPCAEMLPYDAAYFCLYPDILLLREQTGEPIDGQKDAFFDGAPLDVLEQFLANARRLVLTSPRTVINIWR